MNIIITTIIDEEIELRKVSIIQQMPSGYFFTPNYKELQERYSRSYIPYDEVKEMRIRNDS